MKTPNDLDRILKGLFYAGMVIGASYLAIALFFIGIIVGLLLYVL